MGGSRKTDCLSLFDTSPDKTLSMVAARRKCCLMTNMTSRGVHTSYTHHTLVFIVQRFLEAYQNTDQLLSSKGVQLELLNISSIRIGFFQS